MVVHIASIDGKCHLPPDGEISRKLSGTHIFMLFNKVKKMIDEVCKPDVSMLSLLSYIANHRFALAGFEPATVALM